MHPALHHFQMHVTGRNTGDAFNDELAATGFDEEILVLFRTVPDRAEVTGKFSFKKPAVERELPALKDMPGRLAPCPDRFQ